MESSGSNSFHEMTSGSLASWATSWFLARSSPSNCTVMRERSSVSVSDTVRPVMLNCRRRNMLVTRLSTPNSFRTMIAML